MYNVGWVDVFMAWISVLVLVLVLLVAPVVLSCCFSGVTLNGLLCVNAFEDTAFLHCVVGIRVKLARPLQGFIVVFLIIASTGEPLDCVDFMVVVTRSFTPEIVTVVVAPIPPFSVVMIIVAPKVAVVKTFAVVLGVISSRRLLVLLGSFDIFSDELFYVIDVGIIFGRADELSDRARPLAQ
jgi:hypothetical protein